MKKCFNIFIENNKEKSSKIMGLFLLLILAFDIVLGLLKSLKGEPLGTTRIMSIVILIIINISLFYYQKSSKRELIWIIPILVLFAFSNWNISTSGSDFVGYFSQWDYGDLSVDVIDTYSSESFYEKNYPPLGMIFFRLVSYIQKAGVSEPLFANNYITSMYMLICSVIIAISASKIIRDRGGSEAVPLQVAVLFFTGPILYSYCRCNLSLLAFGFILCFLALKDNEKKSLRIFSYIFLALAANLKLYPAVFGFLFANRKDYKKGLACLGIGVSSFVFFATIQLQGNIFKLIDAIKGFAETNSKWVSESKELYEYSIGIKRTSEIIMSNITDDAYIISLGMAIICIAFIVLSILGYILTRSDERKLLILAIFCTAIPTITSWYTTVFWIAPFIYHITKYEKSERNILWYIKLLVYMLVVTYVCGGRGLWFMLPHLGIWRVVLLWLWNFIEIVIERLKFDRNNIINETLS